MHIDFQLGDIFSPNYAVFSRRKNIFVICSDTLPKV
jgi:hypothetical protein